MTPATFAPLYISHGSPMTSMEASAAKTAWAHLAQRWANNAAKPTAVLALSAHTLTREPVLLAADHHEAVHDFSGFPEELYALRYPAPGAPALAQRVAGLIQSAGLPIHTLAEGGMDHGIWTPLRTLFPEGDVPVLPLGWPPHWSPAQLFALGQALSPLVEEGVLIMGSGAITHNLRLWAGGRGDVDAPEFPESAAFRAWIAERSAAADWPALLDYRRQAPHAAHMHPTDEHLLPFFVAAGAAGATPTGLRIHDSVTWGHLGMDIYAFGPAAATLQPL